MKKNWTSIVTVLVCIAVLCMGQSNNARVPMNVDGQSVNPGQVHTYLGSWTRFGGSTAVFSAATTTPGPTARSFTAFQADAANRIHARNPQWNLVKFRFSSATENEVNAYDVFTMVGSNDYFTRVGTITVTTGQATSGITGNEFADTVVVTNSDGLASWRTASPGNNGTAFAMIDVENASYIGISPVTVGASASGVVELCGF